MRIARLAGNVEPWSRTSDSTRSRVHGQATSGAAAAAPAMRGSFRLFRLFGFEIKLNLTWLLLALLITWTLAAGLFPAD